MSTSTVTWETFHKKTHLINESKIYAKKYNLLIKWKIFAYFFVALLQSRNILEYLVRTLEGSNSQVVIEFHGVAILEE